MVGHSFCMNAPRSGTCKGFVFGAALAAIAFGALIAALTSRIGHLPHDAGRILFILFEGLFVCLLGGAIGAGVGAFVSRGGRR
jgi:hypothetical protein